MPNKAFPDDLSAVALASDDYFLIADHSDGDNIKKIAATGVITLLDGYYLNLSNTTPFTPSEDYHPATKKYVDDAVATANEFVELTDTPANYTDAAGKIVRVNSTPDGLEFVALTADLVGAGALNIGANAFTVNSIEIVGADGVVNKAVVEDSGNWDAAYSHVSNDGSDHSYINQSVTTAATPSFAGLTIAGQMSVSSATYPPVTAERTSALTNSRAGAFSIKHKTSGNMADGFGSGFVFDVEDATSGNISIGSIWAVRDGADTYGKVDVYCYHGAAYLCASFGYGEIVINEDSYDMNLRVEGNGNANLLFCDAGNDRVGIKNGSPSVEFDVTGQLLVTSATFPPTKSVRTSTSVSNLPSSALAVKFDTTQNMADGFGVLMSFIIEDSANTENVIGDMGMVRAGADNTGDFIVRTSAAGTTTEKFRITSAGKVGILVDPGTSSYGPLVAGSGSGENVITVYGGTYSSIFFADALTGGGAYAGFIQYTHGTDSLQIGTATLTRMNIDSGGNVVVGSAADNLDGYGKLVVHETADYSVLDLGTWSTGAHYSALRFFKSDHDTIGTKAETDDTDVLGQLEFKGVNSSAAFGHGLTIKAIQNGAAGATYIPTNLIFATHSNSAENSNQLVLKSDGRVAIGTKSAYYDGLTIYAAGTPYLHLCNANTGEGTGQGAAIAVDGTPDLWIMNYEAAGINFYANGATCGKFLSSAEFQSQNHYPLADDTYYLGKRDDDSPLAWKGVTVKDTTNGKYYCIEVINGVITATDLTD